MNYGKSENGSLVLAPHPLVEDKQHIFTNDPEVYERNGWYPVVYTDVPECPEGFSLVESWETINSQTIQRWSIERTGDDA